jgi:hypothetical protein
MGDSNTLEIFKAQVENVRKLESTRLILKKQINAALADGHNEVVTSLTQMYCLLYSTWCEAIFLKILHTPFGFDAAEVTQVLNQKNIRFEFGWEKCLELAFKKVQGWKNSSELPNHIQRIRNLLTHYILNKSIIRNKFAHGQWAIALNGENSRVNPELTALIKAIDFVEVDRWFFVSGKLTTIIEFLIETPGKHYRNNYYPLVVEIDNYLKKTNNYSVEKKRAQLRTKKEYYKNFTSKKNFNSIFSSLRKVYVKSCCSSLEVWLLVGEVAISSVV